MRAVMIASSHSGAGKTSFAIGLIRAYQRLGFRVIAAKAGPDFIDAGWLGRAAGGGGTSGGVGTGGAALTLDNWAMRESSLGEVIARAVDEGEQKPTLLVVEGVMGLFDGARGAQSSGMEASAAVAGSVATDDTKAGGVEAGGVATGVVTIGSAEASSDPEDSLTLPGSSALLARILGLDVIMLAPCRGVGATLAAAMEGIISHDSSLSFVGLVATRCGSPTHASMMKTLLNRRTLPPVLGATLEEERLRMPSRHLGLHQVDDNPSQAESVIESCADQVSAALDLRALWASLNEFRLEPRLDQGSAQVSALPPPPATRKVWVARDEAFAFNYANALGAWRARHVELGFFSPLHDEIFGFATADERDAVFLGGGYPELHATRLSARASLWGALRSAAERGTRIIGECGGYMALGRSLRVDGTEHPMAGLLPMSFEHVGRRCALGYREVTGSKGERYRGHEFRYSRSVGNGGAPPCWLQSLDSSGSDVGDRGARLGRVSGSFFHLIDFAP